MRLRFQIPPVQCGRDLISNIYIEDITRWREDMNFMFEWPEQYLTRSLRSLVRYCSGHSNIKFISSSQRVMFFLSYGETNSTKAKGGNREVIERYDTHKSDIRKIRHSGPG